MTTVSTLLDSCIRPDIRALRAYTVHDATGLVKLDAMENPHRPPSEWRAELGRRLAEVELHRYPGARNAALHAALRAYTPVPENCGLLLGNGSDELISLLALACARRSPQGHTACMLAPEPCFVMYGVCAAWHGMRYVGVPLREDFSLDIPATQAAIVEHRPALLFLAYPNNPTANLWATADIEALIDCAQHSLVVIDEAYFPFADRNCVAYLGRYPNVLLLRTLSKFGLAGVRIGYLAGPQELIAEFDKVRPPYNVSVLDTETALFALERHEVFEAQAADIRAQRDALIATLAGWKKVQVFPSQANMILVRVPDAQRVFAGMLERKVLVKNVSTMHSLLHDCLRLTVGTAAENALMLSALEHSL
ncbi:histidinol-phosphate transaminase [Candidatus Symbiobacter mobilis]|uniref:Histidinol-phosphate aminotransferase n=1 Tax=Candidatus Symbiobacter mobilis CR TaxID=946483 RepID=U5N5T0_9BURK|nr:histidinol-phosphate transaminase [Candidatus Symbiobacter mobilis]AGX86841.1 histidinol-phosphate aminotransferase [Candidatus Symbiobacter mobilis CR]